jgi:hypothetical protein
MITDAPRIETFMRDMVDGRSKPYEAGRAIWAEAMREISAQPDIMHPMWLIWGALTDRVEVRPLEEHAAEESMMRAAREWLAISPANEDARRVYFDRWIYDELGYERKPSK